MTTPNDLSDKALAVFAFAIYHQFSSGDVITAVVANDASGHRVDPDAVAELADHDLAQLKDDKIVFSAAGSLMLAQLVDRLRGHW